MADHWKSLANRLGAPGVDEPEAENQGSNTAMDACSPTPMPARPFAAPPVTPDEVAGPEAALKPEAASDIDESYSKEIRFSPPEPPPRPAEPLKPKPEISFIAEPEELPKTKKRKTSWESLASMFNVKIDRTEKVTEEPISRDASPSRHEAARSEVAPNRPFPEPEPPKRARSEPSKKQDASLSIFSRESAEDTNPALKSMFADAPREKIDNWGSKPRVVDDLTWVDEVNAEAEAEAEEPATQGEQEEETAIRRGRRRRRRRGRADTGAPATEEPLRSKSSWDIDEEEAVDADDPWREPENFDAASEVVELADDELDAEELDTEVVGEVERRSNRRRRRGRGSKIRELPTETGEDIRAEEKPEFLLRGEADESEERASRPRRRRRGRGTSERSEELPRPVESSARAPSARPVVESFESEMELDESEMDPEGDFDDGVEGSTREAPKHRNIPTWADSISSLVQANLENRRRNDNRGAPRGRPRGRR